MCPTFAAFILFAIHTQLHFMSSKCEIRVRCLNEKMKIQLINIAAHEGMGISDFLRWQFKKILDATPPEKKIAPPAEEG